MEGSGLPDFIGREMSCRGASACRCGSMRRGLRAYCAFAVSFSAVSTLLSVSKNRFVATAGPKSSSPKTFQKNMCRHEVYGPSTPRAIAFSFSYSAIRAIHTSV